MVGELLSYVLLSLSVRYDYELTGAVVQIKEGTVGESTTESTEPVETGPRALIKESSRLFIRNLGYSIKDEDLRELLEPFGELENVRSFHLSSLSLTDSI
jgi:hypothetical protein